MEIDLELGRVDIVENRYVGIEKLEGAMRPQGGTYYGKGSQSKLEVYTLDREEASS